MDSIIIMLSTEQVSCVLASIVYVNAGLPDGEERELLRKTHNLIMKQIAAQNGVTIEDEND